jgi:hypothetical protein
MRSATCCWVRPRAAQFGEAVSKECGEQVLLAGLDGQLAAGAFDVGGPDVRPACVAAHGWLPSFSVRSFNAEDCRHAVEDRLVLIRSRIVPLSPTVTVWPWRPPRWKVVCAPTPPIFPVVDTPAVVIAERAYDPRRGWIVTQAASAEGRRLIQPLRALVGQQAGEPSLLPSTSRDA